jgi:hypothetical protein
MGTAGLNVNRLAGLLEQKNVDCSLVEGDSAFDHCVLRLCSARRPALVAFLEYENKGTEPRLAGLSFHDTATEVGMEDYPLDWEKTLQLEGAKEDDAVKISQWVDSEFLKSAS